MAGPWGGDRHLQLCCSKSLDRIGAQLAKNSLSVRILPDEARYVTGPACPATGARSKPAFDSGSGVFHRDSRGHPSWAHWDSAPASSPEVRQWGSARYGRRLSDGDCRVSCLLIPPIKILRARPTVRPAHTLPVARLRPAGMSVPRWVSDRPAPGPAWGRGLL